MKTAIYLGLFLILSIVQSAFGQKLYYSLENNGIG
jgi:hypothetical protein